MGRFKNSLIEQEEWGDMDSEPFEAQYMLELPPNYSKHVPRPIRTKRQEKELEALMKKHLVGKKTNELLRFNDKERHFLFLMRMHYLKAAESRLIGEKYEWNMTEKQEKWFRKLLDR